jgi:F-type H+-transporting ATPase subunit delta
MSSSNKVFKVAQLLLNQSIGENGRIDSERVSAILKELRENPPFKHIEILKRFGFLVRRHMSSYQVRLEFKGGDGSEITSSLCKKNLINENATDVQAVDCPSLIAGFRVKIGDDVYEDSIANRLNNVRKALL